MKTGDVDSVCMNCAYLLWKTQSECQGQRVSPVLAKNPVLWQNPQAINHSPYAEENLSTEKPEETEDPRIPFQDEFTGRKERAEAQARQGSEEPQRVISSGPHRTVRISAIMQL